MTAGRRSLLAELREIDDFLDEIGAPRDGRQVQGEVRPGLELYEQSVYTRVQRIQAALHMAGAGRHEEHILELRSERNYWHREALRAREQLGDALGVNA